MPTTTRTVRPDEPLREGDTYTITMTVRDGNLFTSDGRRVASTLSPVESAMRATAQVTRTEPSITFEPGDVVVVDMYADRYGPSGEFTYVRGTTGFIGDRAPAPTDESMARKFRLGRVRLIARKGHATPVAITRDNIHRLTGNVPF